jgi:peptide/nickel transport system substrate-binding protein
MLQFVSWEVASKENKWQGRNISRWQSKEYDDLYWRAKSELDAVKRAAMYIKLNEIVVGDRYILPEVARPAVTALKSGLIAHLSSWDNNLWQLANWYRET